ncbi:glycosyltransferase family 4 protein [Vreelandella boliviensis]|uniref:GDP-mannose-dependent alpha-(1-6)-phosphatidylinositol monomannoside mannosyltransferase n=1 Tax=Vreelandella boliviensis LC1 TaxID=1072583 RepID=A0A265DWJ3_9GAMM|nr:glycosyltransferase family 4 protein [Halomonas boliviensis]EHJ93072.1 GDP-mannose-dependent alpha-(1-6)-phosphatidylinositol monomannoside mannosyltransferase [Halomonas boliviensis LC1]OZT73687.1 glycosyltransferase WbuB [Halomonas boliviensis LC1]
MKIIYLHQYFNTPEMTGGTRSYEMARRMVAAGYEVHMVTSYREQDDSRSGWFQTEESGIQVHWLSVPYSNHMGFVQRLKAFCVFAFASRRKAIALDGDIIFATSTPLTIALPAVTASRKKKIPMVFEVRDLWPELPIAVGALKNPLLRFSARKLERWAYHNAEAVVALSPGMKEGVVRTQYPAERVSVIPNSSDNAEFQHDPAAASRFRSEREWLGDKPLLVYTGTFGSINGVGYLVKLAKKLKSLNSDIRILLVGDGAERGKIVSEAEQAGVLGVNLFVENKLPKREIPALLSAATMASVLFIDLPEMRPNSANKFFDALASGTPVILNYGGWMHELVKQRECGLAMWGKSVDEVAVELNELMQDGNWLAKAGGAARQLAEDCFARDDLAKQLMSVLEAVVEGSPHKAEQIAPGNYIFN